MTDGYCRQPLRQAGRLPVHLWYVHHDNVRAPTLYGFQLSAWNLLDDADRY